MNRSRDSLQGANPRDAAEGVSDLSISNVDDESSIEARWNVMLREAGADEFVTAAQVLEMRTWMQTEGLWSKFNSPNNGVTLGENL